MMDDTATEQLSAYLDGDLTQSEIAELEHRLSADPELREELEMLRGAIDMLRTHGPVQTPPSLYGDILAAVADEPMPGGFWTWLQRPFGLPLPAMAVALVAIMVLGVTVTGAFVVNGGELLRPAVSDLKTSSLSGSEKGEESKVAQATKDKMAVNKGDDSPKTKPARTSVGAKGAPVKPASTASGKDGWAEPIATNPNSKPAAAVEDASDGKGITTSTSGTAEPEMMMNRGRSTYKVALRAEDLEGIASLYQRYAGGGKATTAKANAIASLEDGTQSFDLTLPSGADRNAFVQELQRRYPGSFTEALKADDTITLDNAVVTLQLTVSHMAPASSGSYEPKYNSVRSKKERLPDSVEENIPESKTSY